MQSNPIQCNTEIRVAVRTSRGHAGCRPAFGNDGAVLRVRRQFSETWYVPVLYQWQPAVHQYPMIITNQSPKNSVGGVNTESKIFSASYESLYQRKNATRLRKQTMVPSLSLKSRVPNQHKTVKVPCLTLRSYSYHTSYRN